MCMKFYNCLMKSVQAEMVRKLFYQQRKPQINQNNEMIVYLVSLVSNEAGEFAHLLYACKIAYTINLGMKGLTPLSS